MFKKDLKLMVGMFYRVNNVNNLAELENAANLARQNSDKPCLIITRTHIGYGSPNKQDSASAHGAPLGVEEVKLTKKNLGWNYEEEFFIPEEVKKHFAGIKECGNEAEEIWKKQFDNFKKKFPSEAELFEKIFDGDLGDEWEKHLPTFSEAMATRAASGKVLNAIAPYLPTLIGGSADLAESNNTHLKDYKSFSADNKNGRNIHFGVREHAMGAMLNGMALYGGVIPYGATFFNFFRLPSSGSSTKCIDETQNNFLFLLTIVLVLAKMVQLTNQLNNLHL